MHVSLPFRPEGPHFRPKVCDSDGILQKLEWVRASVVDDRVPDTYQYVSGVRHAYYFQHVLAPCVETHCIMQLTILVHVWHLPAIVMRTHVISTAG